MSPAGKSCQVLFVPSANISNYFNLTHTLTLLLKLDILLLLAGVAELADAHDSKSCSFGNVGSIPTFGTGTTIKRCFILIIFLLIPVF